MTPEKLRVYQFPGSSTLPTLSPFCLKLETWLRFAGIPYDAIPSGTQASPNGQLPFVEHRGERVVDSDRIIAMLARDHGVDLEAHLTPAQRTTGVMLRAMLDHGLYFAIVHDKFLNPASDAGLKAFLGTFVPVEAVDAVAAGARERSAKKLEQQGLGGRPAAEVHALALSWIDAVAHTLGDQAFLLGDRPTHADASAYGMLAKVSRDFTVTPMKARIASHANLVDYLARIDARYWR